MLNFYHVVNFLLFQTNLQIFFCGISSYKLINNKKIKKVHNFLPYVCVRNKQNLSYNLPLCWSYEISFTFTFNFKMCHMPCARYDITVSKMAFGSCMCHNQNPCFIWGQHRIRCLQNNQQLGVLHKTFFFFLETWQTWSIWTLYGTSMNKIK